jgi:hypothetical protein
VLLLLLDMSGLKTIGRKMWVLLLPLTTFITTWRREMLLLLPMRTTITEMLIVGMEPIETMRNGKIKIFPLVHPVDRGDRDGSPISVHSSLPLLESVPPTPSPSPPPLHLQFIPHGDAGPTYAIQVGPSLHLQPVEQRVAAARLGAKNLSARAPL